ncbi:pirin family protein [Kribbella deserti]|uniref:Pirin family protein n=1 Tax=Kribbella deserti TaxID=1926257 RepID=A0ABV6QJJ1_9ACTN
MSSVEVHRAGDRFRTSAGWLESSHSFSFGQHFDPSNTGFGLLLVSNDDIVAPGTGFDTHPHRDMEIVTWVLSGGLVHQDSEGHNGVIYPGLAQRMSAGRGILHSERNDSWRLTGGAEHTEPVHFVQMWVMPDEAGIDPGYEQLEVDDRLRTGELVPVASGLPEHAADAAIRINQKNAGLYVARLAAGRTAALPTAPYVHLFVALGAIDLEGTGPLATGDAARIEAAEAQRVTAGPDGAEILVWEMHAALR